MTITEDSIISQIIKTHPETRKVFKALGMACLACSGAKGEKLWQGVLYHGLDVEEVVRKLNEVITR